MKKILLNQLECTVVITPGGLHDLTSHILGIRKKYTRIVIITDSTIEALYVNQVQQLLTQLHIPCHVITIPDGETAKTLLTAESCWTKMLSFGADKDSLLISLGGGVISDITGYIASCYMRGIDYVCIPTTLIGMIDASIGGETAINLANNKGSIGTIHHPRLVLVDSKFLNSLPFIHLQNGLVQAIKYAVISDIELFVLLEKSAKDILKGKLSLLNNIIERACDVKADIVRRSIRLQDAKEILQWGCTFGQAIGAAMGQTHPSAEIQAVGMSCEAYLSHQMGMTDRTFIERHEALCEAYGLKLGLPKNISNEAIVKFIAKDTFILANKIGKVAKCSHISEEDITKTLATKKAKSTAIPSKKGL